MLTPTPAQVAAQRRLAVARPGLRRRSVLSPHGDQRAAPRHRLSLILHPLSTALCAVPARPSADQLVPAQNAFILSAFLPSGTPLRPRRFQPLQPISAFSAPFPPFRGLGDSAVHPRPP